MAALPLSTPLSQLLIAFTIEFDNELDHRLAEADLGHRLPISMVMWSNFLRFVEDGITVGELPEATGIPKSQDALDARRHGALALRVRRARFRVEARRMGKRSSASCASGSSAPRRSARKTQEIAPPLFGEIEKRWEKRFGAGAIDELRQALGAVIEGLDLELPEYLPIVGSANGMRAEIEHRERGATDGGHLSALPRTGAPRLHARLRAQVGAVAAADRELRARSRRGGSGRPRHSRDRGRVAGGDDHGAEVPREDRLRHGRGEARPPDAEGPGGAGGRSRAACGSRARVEDAPAAQGRWPRSSISGRLSEGLHPYPDGWRARKKYVEQTNAVIDDPTGRLPHYPMVLHRGGWPDGS